MYANNYNNQRGEVYYHNMSIIEQVSWLGSYGLDILGEQQQHVTSLINLGIRVVWHSRQSLKDERDHSRNMPTIITFRENIPELTGSVINTDKNRAKDTQYTR